MKDHFDKKRDMVKTLLDALKHSAGQELASNPAINPQMPPKMSDGGMAEASDEPSRLLEPKPMEMDGSADSAALEALPGPVEDEEQEKDDLQDMHDADIMDEDEDNNSSSFEAFLPRKRKK